MKTVRESDFVKQFREQLVYASFHLRDDIPEYLEDLKKKTASETHKSVIDVFIRNNEIAGAENRAVCQDTGYVQVFFRIGHDVHVDFSLEKAVNDAVADVYESQCLRESIAHPLNRKNTGTNTPVFTDTELVPGDVFEVTIMIKGGGSENVSKAEFLLPTASEDEIVEWAVNAVKTAGAKACPPYIIGVGIGGNLEKAVRYSKKLLLQRIHEEGMDADEKRLSDRILEGINRLDIGFQGLKFGQTAMAVKVKMIPCHIATLPVALAIGCNAVRQGNFKL
jgi:fumarate hydratase subunit alpha